jgi:hypothetical protein
VQSLQVRTCKLGGQTEEVKGNKIKQAQWKAESLFEVGSHDIKFQSEVKLFDFRPDLSNIKDIYSIPQT